MEISRFPMPCDGCNVDVLEIGEYAYTVNRELWRAVDGRCLLCIGCIESRLGRRLRATDFSHVPLNEFADNRSERLRDRLSGKVYLSEHRLPRARLLRRFQGRLGIIVDVKPVSYMPPEDMRCHVRIRRGDRDWHAALQTGYVYPENVLHHLANAATLAGEFPRARRRAAKAALLLEELLTREERAMFEVFWSLPGADERLEKNDACGLLRLRALLAELHREPIEQWPLDHALRSVSPRYRAKGARR